MSAYLSVFSVIVLLLGMAVPVRAEVEGVTPPRLSYLDGEVSFWRPGVEDWTQARTNLPLAPGDVLYTADDAQMELQVGSREFVRADARTQLGLVNHEAGFLQLQVNSGRVSLDLRQLPAGKTLELNTPHAAFRIAQSGYYRVDVNHETHFILRRGGRATVIPEGGRAMRALSSEEVVVRGDGMPRVETYAAPEPDRWDRWNYARTDELIEAVSARHLPPGIYGAYELDRYGSWRVVPRYGSVWVPDVAHGWSPYSTGRWIWDPYYQWTWIDDAPWGWAPFHYGRWVFIDGFWAWTPGPVAVRTVVYAPALVAFFWSSAHVSVRIGFGTPGVAWVALAWGEPLLPWWGHRGFRGRPWWGGWHGPRVVNNVVIRQTTVVNVTNIVYQNSQVRQAVVAVPSPHFGRPRPDVRILEAAPVREFERVRGALPVKPAPTSLTAGEATQARPPRAVLERPVVSTRPTPEAKLPWRPMLPKGRDEAVPSVQEATPSPRSTSVVPGGSAPKQATPEDRPRVIEATPAGPRLVSPPKPSETALPRPEFGAQGDAERSRPPSPPRYEPMRPAVSAPQREAVRPPEAASRPESSTVLPRREAEPAVAPARIEREREAPVTRGAPAARESGPAQAAEPKALPGNPANRLFRRTETEEPGKGRPETTPRGQERRY